MGIRNEALNRLVIRKACAASWNAMNGDLARRFCAECRRDVFDFERMTPREIRARMEASRGSLCARITRRNGRLSVLEGAEAGPSIEPVSARADRRASSIAAGLVTVVTSWLGAGAVQAQGSCIPIPSAAPPSWVADSARNGSAAKGSAGEAIPRSSATAATLLGLVTDEGGLPLPGVTITATRSSNGRSVVTVTGPTGEFRIVGLEAAAYDVEATLEGFEAASRHDLALGIGEERQVTLSLTVSSAEQITVLQGETALVPKSVPELFAESDLAITAVAAASTVIERHRDFARVATELRVETSYKGSAPGETVLYLHWERLAAGGREIEESARLAPGTRVLAFLESSDEPVGRSGIPAYRSADFYAGVQRLGSDEVQTCLEEIETLVRPASALPSGSAGTGASGR